MPVLENDQIFERYRIVRWLGSGCAGESYEAEDRLLLRKITLKLIHPWSTLPDSARRQFFREMQGISALNHPYLASVLDYGEINGCLYVARRFVSSGSLLGPNGRLWFRPPLAVADAFTYAHQLAQVLQYIHQHGYLHGSLTFSNVLVLRGPNVEHREDYAPLLVADIGLSNFVRRFGRPQIKTLPVSAAPEQSGRRARPASDQFALAVLLYFWLAGRPPYLGTPDEVEKLKTTDTITPLSILNPGVTSEQDSLISRALTAYPENRHTSVLAFTEALQASLSTITQTPLAPTILFPEPEATPRVSPRQATRPSEHPEIPNEGARSNLSPGTSPDISSEHPALPASSEAPQAPARGQLPSIPSTEPIASSLLIEAGNIPDPQSTIPETPRVEEHAIQTALALSAGEEPTTNSETSPVAHILNTDNPLQQVNTDPVEQVETQISADQAQSTSAITTELPETQATDEQPAQETAIADERVETPPLAEQMTQANESTLAAAEVQLASEDTGAVTEVQLTGKDRPAPDAQSAATNVSSTSPCLLIASPYADHIYEFALTGQETSIGRASVSDLRLEQDILTSRHHALLKREGERILIFDKHSSNGVYVNGQRIEAARGYELADGDHIGIGNYELIFRTALGKALSQTSGSPASQSL